MHYISPENLYLFLFKFIIIFFSFKHFLFFILIGYQIILKWHQNSINIMNKLHEVAKLVILELNVKSNLQAYSFSVKLELKVENI